MRDDQTPFPNRLLKLRPGAEILRISAGRLQIAFPNHNAVFTSAEAVQPLTRILDLIEQGKRETEIVDQLTGELERSPGYLRLLLQMLESHACVYPVEDAAVLGDPLDSHYAQTGQNPADLREKLATSNAVLLLPDHLAQQVQADLSRSGLTGFRLLPLSQDQKVSDVLAGLQAQLDRERPAFLACFGLSYRSAAARLLNEFAVAQELPVLFSVIDGLVGRIGPFVIPGETACLECALERILSNSTQDDVHALLAHRARTEGWVDLPPRAHPMFEKAMLGLVLLELSQIALGRFSRAMGGLIEFTATAAASTHAPLLKTPRCPACARPAPQRMAWDARFSAPKVKAADV